MTRAGKSAIEAAMEDMARRGRSPAKAAEAPPPGPVVAPPPAGPPPAASAPLPLPPSPPPSQAKRARPAPPQTRSQPQVRSQDPSQSQSQPRAPAPHGPAVAATPPPVPQDEFLVTQDGLKLRLRRWAAGANALGTVQIVHGLGEHIGRYEHVAQALVAAGWHVAGHDQRGHGRSEGPRGTIPHPLALLGDLAMVTDHLRGAGRHVLLGHSLGGLVAARFVAETLQPQAARFARDFDALVLSSPALKIPLTRGERLLLAVAGRLAPDLRLANGLQPAWVCRDPAVVEAYARDPLVHDRVTPRLVRFMIDNAAFVQSLAPRWRVPTLLLWAGDDLCVDPEGSRAFAAAAPAAVVNRRCYRELFHEVFNEPERADVLADLTQWLRRFQGEAR